MPSAPDSRPRVFTLREVTARVAEIIQPHSGRQFWVRAEISSGRERGGSFFCDLVETGADGKPVAKMACTLARVGLAGFLGRRPGRLSGGPAGNLDTATADEVFALLRSFNRDLGTTFLVVTHDPRLARRCDRVLELVDGRITGETKGSDLAPAC